MDYQQTLDYLYGLQKFGIKLGLNSTQNILAGLGDPHQRLKIVHLAGTNGKGSVGAMLASILGRAGYRVGFYTSPHLVSFRERFVLAGQMIGREEVVELAGRVRAVLEPSQEPTFFELTTAMAFDWFDRQKADLAIMETGMGGRLDATNVAQPLVGVITNISMEHAEHLGRTLAQIAGEKAGIIKPGMDVVTGEKRPRLIGLFERLARERGARLYVAGRDFKARRQGARFSFQGLGLGLKGLETALAGPHQAANAALALAALRLLGPHGFTATHDQIRAGLLGVSWPGRAQIVSRAPDLMLDGAHNPGSARVLAAHIRGLDYEKTHLVLGIMDDKDIRRIMAPLAPLASSLTLARVGYFRAASVERLQKEAAAFDLPTAGAGSVGAAIERARGLAGARDLVLVTGSLFTVGEALEYLTGARE